MLRWDKGSREGKGEKERKTRRNAGERQKSDDRLSPGGATHACMKGGMWEGGGTDQGGFVLYAPHQQLGQTGV